MVEAQLAAGDLLQAFDTAARIPDGASIALPPDSGDGAGADTLAKHHALRWVADDAAAPAETRSAPPPAPPSSDTHDRAETFAGPAVHTGNPAHAGQGKRRSRRR